MDGEFVLVVGSAVLEFNGRPEYRLRSGSCQSGTINRGASGVARNIAENLARLEIETTLLSAVADDEFGEHLITHSALAGVDCGHVLRVSGARTATSLIMHYPPGKTTRLDDFSIIEYIDSDYLMEHEWLFENAALIVIDATLNEEALDTLFELAARNEVRVSADPTSPQMASRLIKYIPNLYLVVPNASETVTLCQLEEPAAQREQAIQTAQQLVNIGASIAVVTLGEEGLAYADSSGGGYIRAVHTNVIDASGAGDALSGAVIFGLLNGVPIDEAMRLGVTAASLTLESAETVLPTLCQELLYDELSA